MDALVDLCAEDTTGAVPRLNPTSNPVQKPYTTRADPWVTGTFQQAHAAGCGAARFPVCNPSGNVLTVGARGQTRQD